MNKIVSIKNNFPESTILFFYHSFHPSGELGADWSLECVKTQGFLRVRDMDHPENPGALRAPDCARNIRFYNGSNAQVPDFPPARFARRNVWKHKVL